MARPDKAAAVAELADEFRGSNAVVLTEYRGLTVKQLTELRRSLGGNASYAVVKNTLTKIAAKEAGVSGIDEYLSGPSAIAFVKGDPVEAAKGLRDFAKANPVLVVKGGLLDGAPLSSEEISKLADLESREVLLAKLAGAMKASMQNAVSLFAAPLAQTARVIEALRQQVEARGPAETSNEEAEADPSILAGGAGTPVAADEAAAVEETVAEATVADAEVPAAEAETAEAPAAETPAEAPAEGEGQSEQNEG